MITEKSEPQVTRPQPLNAHMKIGLVFGAFTILVSQAILLVVYPMNLPHMDVWLAVGSTVNLMTISSAIVLVAGIVERRFGKRPTA